MKKTIKRAICFLLSASLLLSGCGTAGSLAEKFDDGLSVAGTVGNLVGGSVTSTESPEDTLVGKIKEQSTSTYRHGTTYEEDYINQHLEYMKSEEYRTVRDNKGGLAGTMSAAYKAAGLDEANLTWDGFSVFLETYSGTKVELETGYEPVVAELMNSTAAQEAFQVSYESAALDVVVKLLTLFRDGLTNGKKVLSQYHEPTLGSAEETAKKIDKWIDTLEDIDANGFTEISKEVKEMERTLDELEGKTKNQAVGKTSEGEVTTFGGAINAFKKMIKLEFPELMEKEKFDKCLKELGVAVDVSTLVTSTYEEMIDAYMFRMALSQAEEEWYYTWELISGFALSSGTKEGKQISKSIDKILVDLRASSDSCAAAMWESMKEVGAHTALSVSGTILMEYYNNLTNASPFLLLIKAAGGLGHKWSNFLVNMDEISLNGRMVRKTGEIAVYAEKALDVADELLKAEKSMETAILFDEAFHVYKGIQLQACDYAIDYYQAMADTGVNKVVKDKAAEHVTDTQLLLVEKAEWQDYECHGNDQGCYDGIYLAVDDTIYYWNVTKDSYEESGYLRYDVSGYYRESETENTLIARTADGSKREIASVKGGYGELFYVGDMFYGIRATENYYNELIGVKNDGSGVIKYGTGSWVGYDEKNGVMVAVTSESGVITIHPGTGTVTTIGAPTTSVKYGELDSMDQPLIVTEGYLYYHDQDEKWKNITIRVMDLESGEDKEIYRMENAVKTLYGEEFTNFGVGIFDVQETDQYVYVSFGGEGGSAMFYHGGKILRLEKTQLFGAAGEGSRKIAVLCEQAADSGRLKAKDFMAVTEDGKDRVYFNYYDNTESTFAWLSDDSYVEKPYTVLGSVGELIVTYMSSGETYGMFETGFGDYDTILTQSEYEALASQAGFSGAELTLDQLEVSDGHLYGLLFVGHRNRSSGGAGVLLDAILMFDKDLKSGVISVIN